MSGCPAFLGYSAFGALWFDVLFRKLYNLSLGGDAGAPQSGSSLSYVGPAVCSLVITVTSAVLMSALQVDTYGNAVLFALIVGVGYLVANTVTIAINPNTPRPLFYGLISGAYHLAGSLIVGLVLVAL